MAVQCVQCQSVVVDQKRVDFLLVVSSNLDRKLRAKTEIRQRKNGKSQLFATPLSFNNLARNELLDEPYNAKTERDRHAEQGHGEFPSENMAFVKFPREFRGFFLKFKCRLRTY